MNTSDIVVHDKFYIGGEWVKPHGTDTVNIVAAHTGKTFAQVAQGVQGDVEAAIAAARKAFDEGPWPGMTPAERAALLLRYADIIESNNDAIALATAMQNGGLLAANKNYNVPWGIRVLRYYAGMVRDMELEEPRDSASDQPVADITIQHLPLGVVVCICPFNSPFIQIAAKIAPALAAGCTVIIKPSTETPLEAFAYAKAAAAAGFPPGVVNVVTARRDAADSLLASRDVNHISFTGSTAVGRHIAAICATQLKTCSLELGGNAAAIVLEEASMEAILPGLLGLSVMLNNGQACIAQARILVPKSQHDAYAQALAAAAGNIVVGDPTEPATMLGPMVSEKHRNNVLQYIKTGQQEGAQLVAGGGIPQNLPEALQGGFFVEPTVFANVDNSMHISQEEIFGPVITITPYETVEAAIAIANDQPYGLSSSVWGDPERAFEVAKQIVAGSIYVNGAFTIDHNAPFGGLKESGIGKECGPEGLHEYFQKKVIFTPKAPQQH